MNRIDNEVFNITSVEIRVLEPVKAVIPFQDATMGPFSTFGLALIRIEDEDGNVGESPVYSTYTNILEACLLPILLHSPNIPYSELYHRMYWSIRNEGFRGPASGLLGQIDMALHDLAARRAKMPLHRYVGATRNVVKMYGSGGGTNYTFNELEAEVSCFLNAGVDCYKMKVGKDFGNKMNEDVERVKFVRSLLGNNVKLAVDANQIWTCDQALRFIDLTASADLAWFEEPVHSAAYEQIEKLCSHTTVKISFGESERTSRMFPTLLNIGVQHLQPVPTHLGSVKEWMEVKELAVKSQVDLSSGGYSLYTSYLMATAPEHHQVEYLHSIMFGLEEYFSVRPEWKNGSFILPEMEGMPVRVDWDYCKRAGKVVREHAWGNKNVKKYLPTVSM
ncbi:mandelate racemase/muconate lactonizing enzyme family protein [Chitinophagaceae bacterium LB-8]|uniref:Mandelate racemase/muconate lactonizing enzyme family protein n=1 Tax=Paraflavisolibacter caeni TaxID=2982496 RepID=A0A9X2Y0A1_9BACT|nr:mandelate racemase/muconate lactonizing enzyme family protein [Paraflavisolibacter caeni]MCU7552555.1 mandelate racemase/muconate lactonizing enzyme family protein [Paraflavisolibacter caeni]